MGIGPFTTYAPPGVYAQTVVEPAVGLLLGGLRVPVLIGVGKETLSQTNFEMIRGSSSVADTPIFGEDAAGRWISGGTTQNPILGNQDGNKSKFKVRNFPIVDGSGRGSATYDASKVSVSVNGQQVVVAGVDGPNGVVSLLVPPADDDIVSINYFFHRKDTRITDDVSAQISDGPAVLVAPKVESYSVVQGTNDKLIVTVDDVTPVTVTLTPGAARSATDIANDINAMNVPGFTASVHPDNEGLNHVQLIAQGNVQIGNGSANGVLGFNAGDYTGRTKSFRVFNGPIVDGSDGGITTTDPSKVTVTVDGTQVLAKSVDGGSRLVELSFAPKKASKVLITYYFNTFQDTFDYLPNSHIVNVGNVGIAPGRRDFTNGVDFVMVNDGDQSKIQWGTAFQVQPGVKTGTASFDSTQIVGMLVDDRIFGVECDRFVDTTTSAVSTTKFVLPLKATSGNGRDTPLGQSVYTTITNGRLDLPTNRPDLVTVHVGKTWRDASSRPPVRVLEVESSTNTVTLAAPVSAEYKAFATFWYNRLGDDTFTFSALTSGPSGTGTYTIASGKSGSLVYGVKFGTKSSLPQTIQWPSGSELLPDAIHSGAGQPVAETVTVTFSTALDPATHASFSNQKQEPYDIYQATRVFGGVVVDGNPAVSVDLSLQYKAVLLSNGISEPLSMLSSDRLILNVDGVNLASIDLSAAASVADVAAAINAAIDADAQTHADGTATFAATAPNALASVLSYGSQKILAIKGRNLPSFTNGLASNVTVMSPTGVGETDASGKVGLAPNQTAKGSYNAINQVATLVGTQVGPFAISTGVNDSFQLNVDGKDITTTLPGGTAVPLHDVVTSINDAYIALASAADIATYTSDVVALANELRTDYNAHRVSTTYHVAADATNVVSLAAAVTLTDAIALLNDIKAKYNAHRTQGGVHQLDDSVNAITTADASNLQSAVVLANDLKELFNAHLAQIGVHGFDDSVNTLTPAAAPVTNTDCYPILNDLKAKFNAHLSQGGVHLTTDSADVITSANAFSQLTGDALANELKAKFNLHIASTAYHFVQDTTNGIASADSNSPASLVALTTELQSKYPVHLGQSQGPYSVHGTVDGINVTTSSMTELVARTGQGLNAGKLVLTSRLNNSLSSLNVKTTGTANDLLGFASGISAQRKQPTAADIAGALNANASFAAVAVAYRVAAQGLGGFLRIDSKTTGNLSTVAFQNVANTAFVADTKLGIVPGTSGDVGENAQSGFTVSSSQGLLGSHGRGFPGQTYTDATTGLRFTVLKADAGDYASGGSFTLVVGQTFTADASIPIKAVPGVNLTVFNTNNMNPGTTALVSTYARTGAEPAVGDVYYVSYDYAKTDLSTQLFRELKKIQQNFGSPTPDNPLSLAARLCLLNGAILIGLKQILRAEGSSQAGGGAFVAAIDEQRKPIGGSVKPDVIVPLGTEPAIFQALNQHCVFMSTPRQEGERIGVVGVAAGTNPLGVQAIARGLNSELMLVSYPDSYVIQISDDQGNLVPQLVDSSYMAAALAGSLTNSAFDVATPLTHRQIVGFQRVGRILDPTEANQVAVAGVSIIEQMDTGMRVRHGLTTNVDNVITRTPSVTLTIHYVQQTMRRVLDPYIGQKLTGSLIKSVENSMTGAFSQLVDQQIVQKVSGIEVTVDENDPTILRASAIYIPVFPLEYIVVTLSVRIRA